MRGSELAEAMVVVVDRLVNARESTSGLDRVVETIVGMTGRFNRKNIMNYLEAFKAEMLMRDVPDDRQLSAFPRVVIPSTHTEVLEMQADSRSWQEFEERLLKRYGFDDSLQLSKRELMEWVESPRKGRNTSALL